MRYAVNAYSFMRYYVLILWTTLLFRRQGPSGWDLGFKASPPHKTKGISMKLGWKLVLASFVLLLAGCTTIGRPYDASKIGQFVVGQTTVDQAIAALGEPQERETESDGTVRLHYQYIPTDC